MPNHYDSPIIIPVIRQFIHEFSDMMRGYSIIDNYSVSIEVMGLVTAT